MKNKIILSAIFLIAVLVNMHVFTDAFSDMAIPKFRPFGTSTTFSDSSNYVTLNKGFFVRDSIKTDKDLIVKGAVVLDTNRLGKVWYSGSALQILNSKSTGNIELYANKNILLSGNSSGSYLRMDSDGYLQYVDSYAGQYFVIRNDSVLYEGVGVKFLFDINGLSGLTGTQQIKLPSDTASDYASADAVTINRQSGTVTTKSLTTASGDDYTITINNSLVSATTNVWAMIKTNSGSGAPLVRQCATGSGTITVIIRNLGSGSLNSAISFQFLLVN